MSIESIMNGPFIWLLGLFLVALIPFIKFIRNCTKELVNLRKNELDGLNDNNEIKSIFSEMFKIYRKYNRYDSYITYSFWSFVGIIASSAFGIFCQNFDWNQLYAIAPILLFGVIFSGNFIILAWWYVKNI